jgi:hypothetical protein
MLPNESTPLLCAPTDIRLSQLRRTPTSKPVGRTGVPEASRTNMRFGESSFSSSGSEALSRWPW